MSKLKFIDLFSGIGGFHLAFNHLGAECVFASEKDPAARKTYQANFSNILPDLFDDDILTLNADDIPDFDILCAGFPCQPFSHAGQMQGFSEGKESRGNMFFVLKNIIKIKRPKAIFLENVSHILRHDNGRTFQIIKGHIQKELGYDLYYKVVKAYDYGLPQHRPRVFMIAFDNGANLSKDFGLKQFVVSYQSSYRLRGILLLKP